MFLLLIECESQRACTTKVTGVTFVTDRGTRVNVHFALVEGGRIPSAFRTHRGEGGSPCVSHCPTVGPSAFRTTWAGQVVRRLEVLIHLNHTLPAGIIQEDEAFTMECLAAMFSDRGSVLGAVRAKIAAHSQRAILHMYELLHRMHRLTEEVAKTLGHGLKAFHSPVFVMLRTAFLFVSGNEVFEKWCADKGLHAVHWQSRVTFGRFSTFGAAAWTMLEQKAPHPPLWDTLLQYTTAFPLTTKSERCAHTHCKRAHWPGASASLQGPPDGGLWGSVDGEL